MGLSGNRTPPRPRTRFGGGPSDVQPNRTISTQSTNAAGPPCLDTCSAASYLDECQKGDDVRPGARPRGHGPSQLLVLFRMSACARANSPTVIDLRPVSFSTLSSAPDMCPFW